MRILEQKRADYIRTYREKNYCDFCDPKVIKDQEAPVLRGEHWLVLVCKYPYLNGNLIIIPKRHVTDTGKLNVAEWVEFPKVLLATQKLLGKLFKTASFNIALNIGPNSGGSIRHIHWMIVPRPKKNESGGIQRAPRFLSGADGLQTAVAEDKGTDKIMNQLTFVISTYAARSAVALSEGVRDLVNRLLLTSNVGVWPLRSVRLHSGLNDR